MFVVLASKTIRKNIWCEARLEQEFTLNHSGSVDDVGEEKRAGVRAGRTAGRVAGES